MWFNYKKSYANQLYTVFTAILLLLFLSCSVIAAPVNIIIDTDNDSDMDDCGSISMFNNMQNAGLVNILAIVTDTASVNSAAAAQAINTYYGNPNIAIGSCQNGGMVMDHTICDAIYSAFPSALKASGNHPMNAVAVLRSVLAAQPNNSVVYTDQGLTRTLYNLYNSPADVISPMTGAQLIAAKIKLFVICAGDYGVTYPASEWDFISDPTAAQVINNLTSTPIIWIGFTIGNSIVSTVNSGLTTPMQVAANAKGTYTRPSWGELVSLYTAFGLSNGSQTYFTLNGPGTNTVNSSGENTFTTGPGVQYYLTAAESTTNLGTDLGVMVNASVQTYVGGQMRRVFQSGDIPLRVKQAGDISLHK